MPQTHQPITPYKVIIERDEDGFFVASVPSLPGCHTQAKTYPALIKRVKEAIQLCLDVSKDDPGYRARANHRAADPGFIGVDVVTV